MTLSFSPNVVPAKSLARSISSLLELLGLLCKSRAWDRTGLGPSNTPACHILAKEFQDPDRLGLGSSLLNFLKSRESFFFQGLSKFKSNSVYMDMPQHFLSFFFTEWGKQNKTKKTGLFTKSSKFKAKV